jgi:hypothetical protein
VGQRYRHQKPGIRIAKHNPPKIKIVLKIQRLSACSKVSLTELKKSPVRIGIAHLGLSMRKKTIRLPANTIYLPDDRTSSRTPLAFPFIMDSLPSSSDRNPPGQAQPQKARPKMIADTGRIIQKLNQSFLPGHWMTGQLPQLT